MDIATRGMPVLRNTVSHDFVNCEVTVTMAESGMIKRGTHSSLSAFPMADYTL